MDRFGLSCVARHRALGDAQVLPALIAVMEHERGAEAMHAAVDGGAARNALARRTCRRNWPTTCPKARACTCSAAKAATLLYVGKSRNIRSRVFDHFAAEHRSGKESKLTQQVRQVEWIETGGELGALLLESRLVKDLAPTGESAPAQSRRRLRRSSVP